MRKGSRKMWWVVPCSSRKSNLKSESSMDIEEILKMKLETIKEEPESCEENGVLSKRRCIVKKAKKNIHMKVKMGRFLMPHFSLKESYVLCMAGLASKGGLNALPQC